MVVSAKAAALLPHAFGIDGALIPDVLRNARAWVNWRYGERNGKPTKLPVGPSGQPASTTDPRTWSSLEDVLGPSVRADGIGFVFTGEVGPDGLCIGGIDLDDLSKRREEEADDGGMVRRKQRASRIVHEARSRGAYIEISPSGGGLHILGRMRPLPKGIHRDSVEMYTSGRYFTLTTKSASGDITNISGFAEALIREITGDDSVRAGLDASPGPSARSGPIRYEDLPWKIRQTIYCWLTGGRTEDRSARQQLWAGELLHHGGDHSAADLSFVAQMMRRGLSVDETDQAMRASGLMRDKWDEKRGDTTYGDRTLAVAWMGRTGPTKV
jgi:primase-polymerase (primpol)-like protein